MERHAGTQAKSAFAACRATATLSFAFHDCVCPCMPSASTQHPEQGNVNHPRGAIFWMALRTGVIACAIDIEGKTNKQAYYFALKDDQKGLVAQMYLVKAP
jgi:hypothetical protein